MAEEFNSDNGNPQNQIELLSYLLENSSLQDTLLQSYRSQHLSTQSILLAITTGLMFGIANVDTLTSALALFCVQAGFTLFGIYLLGEMIGLINNRGKDVDFWQQNILDIEIRINRKIQIPRRSYFCDFKNYQQEGRPDLDPDQGKTERDREIITEILCHMKGQQKSTHTRNVLDKAVSKYLKYLYILLLLPSAIFVVLLLLNI